LLLYILRRLAYSIVVLLVASFITFWGMRIAFNPLTQIRAEAAGTHRSAADTQKLLDAQRARLHMNETLFHQWWRWFTAFLHGDMGVSIRTHDSVSSMITHALSPTLQLLFWGSILSLALAIGVGVYSAVRQYSIADYTFTGLSYIGIAMPPFAFAILASAYLVTWPVHRFHWHNPVFYTIGLHSTGVTGINLDYFRHLALPVLTLTVQGIASWSRFLRSSMLDVMNADYVRTAKAKGVPRRKVVFKHAFRNALIPFTTVVALDTAFLLGGLIITETFYTIPGMGLLFFNSLEASDAPVLLAWFVITAAAVLVINLFVDLFYSYLDPRIRVTA
jgi:peptide/nickel transport system permease protein